MIWWLIGYAILGFIIAECFRYWEDRNTGPGMVKGAFTLTYLICFTAWPILCLYAWYLKFRNRGKNKDV